MALVLRYVKLTPYIFNVPEFFSGFTGISVFF